MLAPLALVRTRRDEILSSRCAVQDMSTWPAEDRPPADDPHASRTAFLEHLRSPGQQGGFREASLERLRATRPNQSALDRYVLGTCA